MLPHLQFAGNNVKIRAPPPGAMYPPDAMGDENIMPIEQLPINYYYMYTDNGYARDEVAVAKHKKKTRRPISKYISFVTC